MDGFDLLGWEVKSTFDFMNMGELVYISRRTEAGYEVLNSAMEVVKVNPGEPVQPTLRLPPEVLRKLFEHLWERGVRPKDRRFEHESDLLRGQLGIQEKHLEDMRRLVFKEAPRT